MKNNPQHVIVIRRSKAQKAGHHGGSWKIAYADFMTAMMAFFLVMWLLSNSTPLQRQQIAEYFKSPLQVALAGGDKASLSDSVIPGGGPDPLKHEGEINKANRGKKTRDTGMKKLAKARDRLENLIKMDPRLSHFQSNLRLSLTEDGLLIQIIDSQERPMFKVGSKVLEPYLNDILHALVPVLNALPNHISLTGHTDSLPYATGDLGYSNWELSADRANALRRALISNGMAGDKFLRVIGTADTMSVENTQADNPINRRISILVLSQRKEQAILREDTLLQHLPEALSGENLPSQLHVTPVTSAQQHAQPVQQSETGMK